MFVSLCLLAHVSLSLSLSVSLYRYLLSLLLALFAAAAAAAGPLGGAAAICVAGDRRISVSWLSPLCFTQ